MRYSRAQRHGDTGLFGGAGWLFADLMLAVLVAVYLASVIIPARSKPPGPPPPRPTPTVQPPTTTSSPPEGLDRTPVTLDVEVDDNALLAGDPAAVGALQAAMRDQLLPRLAGRRAGLVLTFGTGTASGAGINRARQIAMQFNGLVLMSLGGQFSDAVYRPFFQGGGDLRKVSLEIYVFDR